jgi:uncharacterized membrane protein
MKMSFLMMSSGTLQAEERRLTAARDDAVRMRRSQTVGRLCEKLTKLRKEIERRHKRGEY